MFAGTSRTRDPLTIPEQSEILQHFFRDKVISSDVQIIRLVWNDKYEAFKTRTLRRAEAYEKALVRQKAIVDSMMSIYRSELNLFQEDVKNALSEEQLKLLQAYRDQSVIRLHEKRDEFLLHETRLTKPITPSLYNYFQYSFQLMEEIPSSYYYSLVGGKKNTLAFVKELPLEKYYLAYKAFENALIKALDENGGRAHVAIPAYYSGARYQGEHTQINALHFGLLNWYGQ